MMPEGAQADLSGYERVKQKRVMPLSPISRRQRNLELAAQCNQLLRRRRQPDLGQVAQIARSAVPTSLAKTDGGQSFSINDADLRNKVGKSKSPKDSVTPQGATRHLT